jgi:hypothetical protein
VRFQRSQLRQTTQSRPFSPSNATRRPIGNASIESFTPSGFWQWMQIVYIEQGQGLIVIAIYFRLPVPASDIFHSFQCANVARNRQIQSIDATPVAAAAALALVSTRKRP